MSAILHAPDLVGERALVKFVSCNVPTEVRIQEVSLSRQFVRLMNTNGHKVWHDIRTFGVLEVLPDLRAERRALDADSRQEDISRGSTIRMWHPPDVARGDRKSLGDEGAGSMTPPRTVKVRIACAVDPTGKWSACSWSDDSGGYDPASEDAIYIDDLTPVERRYFITAELPVPQAGEVAGVVEESGND